MSLPLVAVAAISCAQGDGARATTQSTSAATTATTTVTARRGPTTRPSEAPVIAITGVERMVQVRDSSNKPWQKAIVGMNVTEGAEFRTGPKSAVRLAVPPDRTITLDRLGVVRLGDALREAERVPTRRTSYDGEEAGIEQQSELVSPSSTLSIRGQKVRIDKP
jgi:hypothetical protein